MNVVLHLFDGAPDDDDAASMQGEEAPCSSRAARAHPALQTLGKPDRQILTVQYSYRTALVRVPYRTFLKVRRRTSTHVASTRLRHTVSRSIGDAVGLSNSIIALGTTRTALHIFA